MVICVIVLCMAGAVLLPPVRERLAWHANEIALKVKYALNPPEKEIFVPQQAGTPAVSSTPLPTSTPSPTPIRTATASGPTETPLPSLTATVPATPLPPSVSLKGVHYEDQHGRLNYCAPANLSMALSYWGWNGNRDVVGPVLKPDDKDKNVMPYEMVDYVNGQTDLRAVERVGGDLDLLKRFLAAGYVVLVEKGVYLRDLTGVVSWMGHYQVITGYDDANSAFTTQDSFISADHPVSYDDLIAGWRAFNYTYIIIYPPDKEAEVMDLLGADADETANYQNASLKASNEIYGLAGIDQYFAWFNRGTNLMNLQDFAGAAAAYDEAFTVYPTIPEADRPWRMLWYQTGPYFAYFYSGRYYDTLYLADGTLNAMQGDRNLEESYYWRAMAKAALGDTSGAIQDFQASLEYHPGFEPALYQLRLLGVENP
jgi:hypothetical protein